MAVLQMQRISIYGMKKGRKSIVELLQRRGVVEITEAEPDDTVFKRADMLSAQSTFERHAALAAQALELLQIYAPEKKSMLSSFSGRTILTLPEYETAGKNVAEAVEKAGHIVALSKKVTESEAEALRLQAQADALEPWLGLDISLRTKGTKSTAAFIGAFAGRQEQEALQEQLALGLPDVKGLHLDVVSLSTEQTCVFALCARQDAAAVEEQLRSMGFSYPASPPKRPPGEKKAQLLEKIGVAQEEAQKAREDLRVCAKGADELRFAVDFFTLRAEKYRVIGGLRQSRHVFVATGYVPARDAAALALLLENNHGAAVELSEPSEKEDVPVLLQNNAFATPVEPVLESYSLPGKGEIDPCSVMAGFYYVLFGMMLSDAAYGLIMVLVCGVVLRKFKNMEAGMRKAVKMFFYCGFTTMFWGVMFASYFGDAIEVAARTFFNTQLVIPALWFRPVQEPMRLLVFSFLIGIVHIFTGLGVGLYQNIKKRNWRDALYDQGFWYMLVGGAIVFGLSTKMLSDMLSLGFTLPATVGNAAGILAGIGAVGIVATAGRESRSPVKRILKGIYGLYNISGYLSDILSYSRLLALGLATGVIASVFNQMAAMGGGGIVGAILFVVVFLLGHTMNIGINLLGAYVHTNRLQYVEFFGKFYNGGGRKFMPFAVRTKYYKIEEDK